MESMAGHDGVQVKNDVECSAPAFRKYVELIVVEAAE